MFLYLHKISFLTANFTKSKAFCTLTLNFSAIYLYDIPFSQNLSP